MEIITYGHNGPVVYRVGGDFDNAILKMKNLNTTNMNGHYVDNKSEAHLIGNIVLSEVLQFTGIKNEKDIEEIIGENKDVCLGIINGRDYSGKFDLRFYGEGDGKKISLLRQKHNELKDKPLFLLMNLDGISHNSLDDYITGLKEGMDFQNIPSVNIIGYNK